MNAQRVVEHLNQGLHKLLADRPELLVLGEDILDPYGGAFGATRGLSTAYPDRVLATPLSEGGFVGAAVGYALAGGEAIAEIMFGDFVALAFDPIVNAAAKSTAMFGRPVRVPLVVRCPSGGNRGYGPTHSQSLQKHFLGVPGLSVYELSPFHDPGALLAHALDAGKPAVQFEDKVLYTAPVVSPGRVDDLFQVTLDGAPEGVATVYLESPDEPADCVLISTGGMANRAVAAMRSLLLQDELVCKLLVPSQLYPLPAERLLPGLRGAGTVCVVEESSAGGTWGADVAQFVHERLWGSLRRPVRLIHSADDIIPAAPHLEREVLVQAETIQRAVREACER